jgi:hypothetical protein
MEAEKQPGKNTDQHQKRRLTKHRKRGFTQSYLFVNSYKIPFLNIPPLWEAGPAFTPLIPLFMRLKFACQRVNFVSHQAQILKACLTSLPLTGSISLTFT